MKKAGIFFSLALLLNLLSGPAYSSIFYEVEPNNSWGTAQLLQPTDGILDVYGSRVGNDSADYYSFFATAESLLSLRVYTANQNDPAIDPVLALFSSTGTLLFSDDDTFGYSPAFLNYKIPSSGLYILAVSGSGDFDFTGGGSAGWDYRLTTVPLPVPLPAAAWLMMGGMLMMGSFMRRTSTKVGVHVDS